jgi:hypothetical protein
MDWWISKNDDIKIKTSFISGSSAARNQIQKWSRTGIGVFVRQRPSILISRDMGLGINPKLM